METFLSPSFAMFFMILCALLCPPTPVDGSCNDLNYCSGHGYCMNSRCVCDEGWGALTDITRYRSPTCSQRTCPSGRSWGDLNSGPKAAHRLAECSDKGFCDRTTGTCKCVDGFSGVACQRTTCPNDCSGHGRCLSMRQMAMDPQALPLSPNVGNIYRGSPVTVRGYSYLMMNNILNESSWDGDMIYGCVCDSSWKVGLGAGETQEPEWFGPDCSLRHCPSANDPLTAVNETDCFNVTATNSQYKGSVGNLCHVDCANRGICDYSVGMCRCFAGFYGERCNITDALSTDKTVSLEGLAQLQADAILADANAV